MNWAKVFVGTASGTMVIRSKMSKLNALDRGRVAQIFSSNNLLVDHSTITTQDIRYSSMRSRMMDETSDVARKLEIDMSDRFVLVASVLTVAGSRRRCVDLVAFYGLMRMSLGRANCAKHTL